MSKYHYVMSGRMSRGTFFPDEVGWSRMVKGMSFHVCEGIVGVLVISDGVYQYQS